MLKAANALVCKGSSFTDTWNGRMHITNFDKSQIAKKCGIKANGEYAKRRGKQMEITILSEKEEPLLKRKTVKAELSEYTPRLQKSCFERRACKEAEQTLH